MGQTWVPEKNRAQYYPKIEPSMVAMCAKLCKIEGISHHKPGIDAMKVGAGRRLTPECPNQETPAQWGWGSTEKCRPIV